MPLRYFDAPVAEQYRDPFQGDAGQEEFYCERIAKPVRVPSFDTSQLEKLPQATPVVSRNGIDLAFAGPKKVPRAHAWNRPEFIHNKLGQLAPYREIRLVRGEKEPVTCD